MSRSALLFSLCVLCYSIVGLGCVFVAGLCDCGMAVMVCVGWKGRVLSTVYRLLSTHHRVVVCISVVCVVCGGV